MFGRDAEIVETRSREDLGLTLGTGYDSQDNFNGVKYGTHLAWTRLDWEAPLTGSLFLSLGAWHGDILGDRYDDFHREFDYSVALTCEFDPFTELSLVFTHYTFFGDIPDEPELGLEFAKRIGRIDFALWYGYDFELDGHYLEAQVSSEFVINDWLSIVPSVELSYASGYNVEGSGFNHTALRVDFPLSVSDRITITPFIEAVFPIGTLRAGGLDEDEVHGGVALEITF